MKTDLPRLAAMHDLTGYGKCALTVALPVLSVCGVEVCPLPTALLSANTIFEEFTFFDFTANLKAYLANWQKLDLQFDCLYSGFLGSAAQIEIAEQFIGDFKPPLIIIDPVMGEDGQIIKTYNQEMCDKMRTLVAKADLITPNITEACILSEQSYQGSSYDQAASQKLITKLKKLNAKNVVLTGVVRGDKLYNCCLDEKGHYFELEIDLLAKNMHGTGDLFTSVLTGGLLNNYSLEQAVKSAGDFVHDAMLKSYTLCNAFERGVGFEQIAYKLAGGIYRP